jgi:hypothetical protein
MVKEGQAAGGPTTLTCLLEGTGVVGSANSADLDVQL